MNPVGEQRPELRTFPRNATVYSHQASLSLVRRSVLAALATDIDEDTPPDEVVETR